MILLLKLTFKNPPAGGRSTGPQLTRAEGSRLFTWLFAWLYPCCLVSKQHQETGSCMESNACKVTRENKTHRGRGEGWELQLRSLVSPLLFHWKRNRKSDLNWIPAALHILALYTVPFLLKRASECHVLHFSTLLGMSA